jgi:hypothetical protein
MFEKKKNDLEEALSNYENYNLNENSNFKFNSDKERIKKIEENEKESFQFIDKFCEIGQKLEGLDLTEVQEEEKEEDKNEIMKNGNVKNNEEIIVNPTFQNKKMMVDSENKRDNKRNKITINDTEHKESEYKQEADTMEVDAELKFKKVNKNKNKINKSEFS